MKFTEIKTLKAKLGFSHSFLSGLGMSVDSATQPIFVLAKLRINRHRFWMFGFLLDEEARVGWHTLRVYGNTLHPSNKSIKFYSKEWSTTKKHVYKLIGSNEHQKKNQSFFPKELSWSSCDNNSFGTFPTCCWGKSPSSTSHPNWHETSFLRLWEYLLRSGREGSGCDFCSAVIRWFGSHFPYEGLVHPIPLSMCS